MVNPQDLFDYGMENGVMLEVPEIMEAISKFPDDIMDAFDYAVGVPEEILREERGEV